MTTIMLPVFFRALMPDSKLRMLMQLADQAEIVIVISADDIEKNKVRGDLGITYDSDVLRLIDAFRQSGLYVGSVVITQYGRAVQRPDDFQTSPGEDGREAFYRPLSKSRDIPDNIRAYRQR